MHPDYQFVVLDFVRDEVTRHYATQLSRLRAALDANHLLPDDPPESIDLTEVELFAEMSKLKIGEGERAAIAAAKVRSLPLVIDDERALKRAASYCLTIPRESTVSLMLALLSAGIIEVTEADEIKADWELNHRFRLRFESFSEQI
jgi:predicted nucleic acid-binding protein